MEKFITIKFPDVSYFVNARFIATERAKCYANDPDTTLEEEIEYALNDDYELRDYMINNMDWDEIEPQAVPYKLNSDEPENRITAFYSAEVDVIPQDKLEYDTKGMVELWVITKLRKGLRLGQLVENIKAICKQNNMEDIFYVEDGPLLKFLDEKL